MKNIKIPTHQHVGEAVPGLQDVQVVQHNAQLCTLGGQWCEEDLARSLSCSQLSTDAAKNITFIISYIHSTKVA